MLLFMSSELRFQIKFHVSRLFLSFSESCIVKAPDVTEVHVLEVVHVGVDTLLIKVDVLQVDEFFKAFF